MDFNGTIIWIAGALVTLLLSSGAVKLYNRRVDRLPSATASSGMNASVLLLPGLLFGVLAVKVMSVLLLGVADRYLMHPAVEHHLRAASLAVLVPLLFALCLAVRGQWSEDGHTLPHTVSEWGSLLFVLTLASFLLQEWVVIGARVWNFATATSAEAVRGSVIDSYSYKRTHCDRMRLAKVQLPDGTSLYVTSRDTFFSNRLVHGLKVNDTCALDRLPRGLQVSVSIRRSSRGIALDGITSQQPCADR